MAISVVALNLAFSRQRRWILCEGGGGELVFEAARFILAEQI